MFLIDTNILIYHFNKEIPEKSKAKIKDIFLNYFNISVITKMEFLGFKGHSEESYNKSKKFLDYASVLSIDDTIVDLVIDLKRKNTIKLPDAIIAATAINEELTLVTRNDNDFKNINIEIYNPFK